VCMVRFTYLADSWGTAEESDVTASFAADDVVKVAVVHGLGLCEGEDEFFLVFGED
jgi:hypothetical protein